MKVAPENLARRKFPIQIIKAVLDEEIGELMRMRHLIKKPKYHKVWRT